jgi:N-acetylglucosaminyldiphosphoundecaprenol N-acetyl-beta-D-mannosaminyltransferase
MLYRRDAKLYEVIEESSFPFTDGAGAVLALKYLYGERSMKLDLPKTALDLANTNKWKLFVLGSQEEVNKTAFERIQRLYPDIQLVGRLNGFESEEEMLRCIKMASPQLVLIGLGSPKQEFLCYRMRKDLDGTFMIGCGGALDVLAGKSKRAPNFMINNNLEWLYRLYKQPSRWRRQLRLVEFLAKVIIERIENKRSAIQRKMR